ncbi:MAG: YkvA family protein [Gammaproteobacteria bacterium]|nr:YkvA family protein [Gammaproteobacteria bacterium]
MSGKPRPPTRFARYRERARELARSPEEVASLATAAAQKLASTTGVPRRFREGREELSTFIALLKAWVNGDYRQVSTRTLVTVIAAVLYFVVPFDLIPDFIAAIGLLDDAAVIGYVIGVVREEITEFERWRNAPPDEGQSGGSGE